MRVSLIRLQAFIKLNECSNADETKITMDSGTLIEMEECTFGLKEAKERINASLIEKKDFLLQNLSVKIKPSQLIGVVGAVGSGKTFFLNSILDETERISGTFNIHQDLFANGYAYVSEDLWLQNTTIRENILFGKKFDQGLYSSVLDACALNEDLAQMPDSDHTVVGQHGMTLSGGQKIRICLARACYHNDKEVYLLDDPLSGLDTHVARHVFDKCINGLLKLKARVFCTHRVEYISQADHVIMLADGVVIGEGLPNRVLPDFLSCKSNKLTNGEGILKSFDMKTAKTSSPESPESKTIELYVYKVRIWKLSDECASQTDPLCKTAMSIISF
jgi:ABC-type multidrug transport system fused ATPase/permease subunit